MLAQDEGSVFITGEVKRELAGTAWEPRVTLVDVRPRRHASIEVYRLGKAESDSASS
jgi:phage baseplate assembly protein W